MTLAKQRAWLRHPFPRGSSALSSCWASWKTSIWVRHVSSQTGSPLHFPFRLQLVQNTELCFHVTPKVCLGTEEFLYQDRSHNCLLLCGTNSVFPFVYQLLPELSLILLHETTWIPICISGLLLCLLYFISKKRNGLIFFKQEHLEENPWYSGYLLCSQSLSE